MKGRKGLKPSFVLVMFRFSSIHCVAAAFHSFLSLAIGIHSFARACSPTVSVPIKQVSVCVPCCLSLSACWAQGADPGIDEQSLESCFWHSCDFPEEVELSESDGVNDVVNV